VRIADAIHRWAARPIALCWARVLFAGNLDAHFEFSIKRAWEMRGLSAEYEAIICCWVKRLHRKQ